MRTGNIVGNRMIQARELLNLLEDQHPIGEVDLDKFLGDITSKLKSKTKLNVDGTVDVGRGLGLEVRFEYKYFFEGNKVLVGFFEQYRRQFRIIIKSLELVCKGEFKLIERPGDWYYYWRNLDVDDLGVDDAIRKHISINLYLNKKFLLLVVKFSIVDEDSDGPGIYSIPLSHDMLDKLIDATADVFIGYKKLVNHFNNKPDKKTNVDW